MAGAAIKLKIFFILIKTSFYPSVKVEEDDYDLVEEAILMEQNIVKDPIIDDYEIDYNQLSEVIQNNTTFRYNLGSIATL